MADKEVEARAITAEEKKFDAYTASRQAWVAAKYAGIRKKRADEKAAAEADAKAMPPPLLKSTKGRRSPTQQQFSLDPSAAIRRFPSVTVVDDRKGHWRSVSFISVKSSK